MPSFKRPSQLRDQTKVTLYAGRFFIVWVKYNIKDKKFFVRIFKKKKKIPNEEYPICNFDSKVKDYGKSHFCLVDEENSEPIEEEEKMEDKKE